MSTTQEETGVSSQEDDEKRLDSIAKFHARESSIHSNFSGELPHTWRLCSGLLLGGHG